MASFQSPTPGFQKNSFLNLLNETEVSEFEDSESLLLPKPYEVIKNFTRYREDEEDGGPRVEETEIDRFDERDEFYDDGQPLESDTVYDLDRST